MSHLFFNFATFKQRTKFNCLILIFLLLFHLMDNFHWLLFIYATFIIINIRFIEATNVIIIFLISINIWINRLLFKNSEFFIKINRTETNSSALLWYCIIWLIFSTYFIWKSPIRNMVLFILIFDWLAFIKILLLNWCFIATCFKNTLFFNYNFSCWSKFPYISRTRCKSKWSKKLM